jgi:hypothetical protein
MNNLEHPASRSTGISLSKIATAIPLLAAASFLVSAAFLVGTTAGIGEPSIIQLFEVSDIANNAIFYLTLATSAGVVVPLLYPLTRGMDKIESKLATRKAGRKYFFAVGLAPIFTGILIGYLIGSLSLLAAVLLAAAFVLIWVALIAWRDFALRRFERRIRLGGGIAIMAVALAFLSGAWGGYRSVKGSTIIRVQTDYRTLSTRYFYALERGAVLAKPSGFELVPWNQVKSIMILHDRGARRQP